MSNTKVINLKSEQALFDFGKKFAKSIHSPATIELVGDVGSGKTTFTRGLAIGLDIKEPVTSPSFTISKRYTSPTSELIHYDFYRLPEPGIMQEDLAESISNPNAITVIEWADSIADLLPPDRIQIRIIPELDNSRTLQINML